MEHRYLASAELSASLGGQHAFPSVAHIPLSELKEVEALMGRVVPLSELPDGVVRQWFAHPYPRYFGSLSSNSACFGDSSTAEGFGDVDLGVVVEFSMIPQTWDPDVEEQEPQAVYVHRIVSDILGDALIAAEIQESEERRAFAAKGDDLFVAPGGLTGYVLKNSKSSVMRRLRDLVDATAKASLSEARYRLQEALTANGLGRINGLDPAEFEKLSSEALINVMLTAMKAYKDSTLAGAMYYVSRKGTDRTEFNAWYDRLMTQHGWNRDGVQRAFQVWLTIGSRIDSAQVTKFCMEPAEAFIDFLLEVENRSDLSGEQRRKFGMRTLESRSDLDSVLDILSKRPARSLGELVKDDTAQQSEILTAVLAAQDAGVSLDDASLLKVVIRLDPHMRAVVLRSARFEFFFKALKEAHAREDAAERNG